MTAPRNAGSLTAGLLARKGLAQPAMRRQTVTGLGPTLGPRAVPLDDLGWNDMGEDVEQATSPVAQHIATIQETLERRKADRRADEAASLTAPAPHPVPEAAPAPESEPAPEPAPIAKATPVRTGKSRIADQKETQRKARSAFTLRIDAERHLRLRLLSAVTNRSAQQLLTGALDALLAQHPQIDALAASARLQPGSGGTGTE